MNRLILMRHAKTEPWHEGVDDHGRALIARGHADAALVADALQARGLLPDHALVSTARRARETWRALLPALSGATVEFIDELYLAAPVTIEDVLGQCAATGTVIVVAHNPGLHDLACDIARKAGCPDDTMLLRLFESFPTGCTAIFEAANEGAYSAGRFTLVDLIRARDLREGRDP